MSDKKLRKLLPKFINLLNNHGRPFICRELEINMDDFNRLFEMAGEK